MRRTEWLVAVVVAFTPLSVSGQRTVQPCPDDCSLRVMEKLRLGDVDGPGFVESKSDWARQLPSGNWALVPTSADHFNIFSPDGQFIRRVGREGDGPGEYRDIAYLEEAGDTIIVADRVSGRATYLGPALDVVRTISLGVRPERGFVRLDDGRFIASTLEFSPERVGLPLHTIDTTGAVVESFGSTSQGAFSIARASQYERMIGPSEGGEGVWAAWRSRYRLERWSADGELEEILERDVDWFPDGDAVISLDREPDAQIVGVTWHENHLWVLSAVVDDNWAEGIELDPNSAHGGDVSDIDLVYDTRIEVIDPVAGRVVAQATLDPFIFSFVGPGLIGTTVMDGRGNPSYVIYELNLPMTEHDHVEG